MRLLMMVLTAVLIFFFINVMLLVSDIQGTARVVNYAGLVRGTTQRIVKLEDAGQPQDDLLKAVDSYINGLRYGSDNLNLVRLDDEYQAKMTELANYFDTRALDKSESIGIAHADNAEGAQALLALLREKGFTGECLTVCYEPVTGAHVGPGTVALFFYGTEK